MSPPPQVPVGYLDRAAADPYLKAWMPSSIMTVLLRVGATKPVRNGLAQSPLTAGLRLVRLPGADWSALSAAPPYEVGVEHVGWYPVTEALLPEPGSAAKFDWCLLRLDPLRRLPSYVQFSSYDIGHDVVVVAGPAMGTRARVSGIHAETYKFVGTMLMQPGDSLGAVGVPSEDLLPMKVRLPVDSPVWFLWQDQVLAGLVTDYPQEGTVYIWAVQEQKLIAVQRDRTQIVERVAGQPCPLVPPIPKNRRVPPARAGAKGRRGRGRDWDLLSSQEQLALYQTRERNEDS